MSFQKYTSAEHAILTTLLYSDIFSFPLTKNELWRLLITKEKISRRVFEASLPTLKTQIAFEKGYYCLSGREKIITHRIANIPEVEKKMRLARNVAKKLAAIPSVLFIGISGGLAVGNVSKKDDIDFVFIVKRKTLFISRLLILGVLEKQGVRRARTQKHTANTICANLFFDETALDWFGNSQDVYTAREIAQMQPLFVRGNIYQQFLKENKWIEDFLPNVTFQNVSIQKSSVSRINNLVTNSVLETLARVVQLRLIRRHQTKEIVTKHILAFHPNDYRVKTLRQLRLKMRQIGLLTIF